MISAGSAVSESSTAPSTDCSASRFWGGAAAAPPLRSAMAIGVVESRSAIGALGDRASLSRFLRRVVTKRVSDEFHARGTSVRARP